MGFLGAYLIFALVNSVIHAAEPGIAPDTTSEPSADANTIIIAQAEQRASQAEKSGDIPSLVQALNDEADGQLRAHDFDAAEKLRLRVLHLQEQHAGRNSLAVSDALLNLGWFYGNMARYESAQEALDRCQEIR